MIKVERIVGGRLDQEIAGRLHHLEHQGSVEQVVLETADLSRRRLRATTSAGSEVAIALTRDQRLYDGAVLYLDSQRAILVRVAAERWIRFQCRSIPDAIELGYHAGNLHWRVRFEDEALLVAIEAPAEDYISRLGALVSDGRVVATTVQSPGSA